MITLESDLKPRLNDDSHGVLEEKRALEGAGGETAMLALPAEEALCGSCDKAATIVGHMTKTKATYFF